MCEDTFLRALNEPSNLHCSRRPHHSSTPLLQSGDPLIEKSSREPSIHESVYRDIARKQRQFSGWKVGVVACAATAGTVCLLNITLTIWAVANHSMVDGLSYLYTGSCSEVANMSLWMHLGINAMSTLLLSASNCELLESPKYDS